MKKKNKKVWVGYAPGFINNKYFYWYECPVTKDKSLRQLSQVYKRRGLLYSKKIRITVEEI